jgi:hypothetical protein
MSYPSILRLAASGRARPPDRGATDRYRTILPHLALPLAASYVVIYRLQEASEAKPIVSNKNSFNRMREG